MVSERRVLGWVAGLVALLLVSIGAGIWLIWLSAGWQIEVNEFYNSTIGNTVPDDEVYRHWDRLSQNAYTVQQLSPPLLIGGMATLIVILAVLARRWDLSRDPGREPDSDSGEVQVEATVAS